MKAIVAGPTRGIADALEAEGVAVARLDGVITGERLDAAGVTEAELFVLTDAEEATAIPVALEANPGLRVVAYVPDSLPEFASAQADLVVQPGVLDAAIVAEELVAGAE
jgi:hypothetical protein